MADELKTEVYRVVPVCFTCRPRPRGKDHVPLINPGENPCLPEPIARQRIDEHKARYPKHIVDFLEGVC